MNELAAALEATALAQHLKSARWGYPVVSALHIFGIALLIGALVPLHVRTLRGSRDLNAALRPFAIAGLCLAAVTGGLLFATQAQDYLGSRWMLAKLAVIALALLHAAWHWQARSGRSALVSLGLWIAVLFLGRMIGFG